MDQFLNLLSLTTTTTAAATSVLYNNSYQFPECDYRGESFCPSSGRKFVVFDEDKKGGGGKDCDSAGVNFINIIQVHFLYKSILHSFSLVTVWLCNFLATEYRCKSSS